MTEIADLPAAASASAAALAGYCDLDWQPLPAADLEWSCWKTARSCTGTYLRTELALDDSASPARLLDAERAR
jgi:hypothetical protein